ncbi:MAG: hypothetical protein AAF518_20450, partial [Spirochaetota bacterium]
MKSLNVSEYCQGNSYHFDYSTRLEWSDWKKDCDLYTILHYCGNWYTGRNLFSSHSIRAWWNSQNDNYSPGNIPKRSSSSSVKPS